MTKYKVFAIAVLAIVMLMVAGCASAPVQKSASVAPVVTQEKPVASVKMTSANGVLTADITNNMYTAHSYTIVTDFYDGDVKVDTRMVDVFNLAPGETGRAKGAFPPGANRYKVSGVITTVGGKPYSVIFDVSYT